MIQSLTGHRTVTKPAYLRSVSHASHLDEIFTRDLRNIQTQLRVMGDLVLANLKSSMIALADLDRKRAYRVVLADNRVDVLEGHIDRLCQEFLVRHMPVAKQLRFVLAAVKVNAELERIGDYAEALARRAVGLATTSEFPMKEPLLELSQTSYRAVRLALEAFIEGDAEKALQIFEVEGQVDERARQLYRELTHTGADASDLAARFVLLGALNRIERVADRAANIAEDAIYVEKGDVKGHRPRSDVRILFLCHQNHSRSQMAEGIARAKAPSHFVITSAGTDPQALDPAAVAYMAERGHDISRQRPSGIDDIGSLEGFHVIVTLSEAAEEAYPTVPYRTVVLNWEVADPSAVTGTPQETEAVYRAVYEELDTKIGELIESLQGVGTDRDEEET